MEVLCGTGSELDAWRCWSTEHRICSTTSSLSLGGGSLITKQSQVPKLRERPGGVACIQALNGWTATDNRQECGETLQHDRCSACWFSQILGKRCPYGGGLLWCRTGRYWVVIGSIQSRKVSVVVATVLKLNFVFHTLGERGPLWGGPSWCQMGRQWLPTDRITNPLHVCLLWFCRRV